MNFAELVASNRTVRRFNQSRAVTMAELDALADLARLTGSKGNFMPLKYVLSCAPETNRRIFETLGWAAYLPDWPGPAEGERPGAYVVVMGDTTLAKSFSTDAGIVMQTMLLGARTMGLGGCMFGSVNRDKLREVLDIPAGLDILYVVALGEPAEQVAVEPVTGESGVKYWRTADGVHHVPKRGLDELVAARYE